MSSLLVMMVSIIQKYLESHRFLTCTAHQLEGVEDKSGEIIWPYDTIITHWYYKRTIVLDER